MSIKSIRFSALVAFAVGSLGACGATHATEHPSGGSATADSESSAVSSPTRVTTDTSAVDVVSPSSSSSVTADVAGFAIRTSGFTVKSIVEASEPASNAYVRVMESGDGSEIRVAGDQPSSLGELESRRDPVPADQSSALASLQYATGSLVVVASSASRDSAVEILQSALDGIANDPSGYVPEGFTAASGDALAQPLTWTSISYVSAQSGMVLRFARLPVSTRVEFAQPSPASFLRSVDGRMMQINSFTGTGGVVVSWVQDDFVVALITAGQPETPVTDAQVSDALDLARSVYPADSSQWASMLSQLSASQAEAPVTSSFESEFGSLTIRSDGESSLSLCLSAPMGLQCKSMSGAGVHAAAFRVDQRWFVAGVADTKEIQVTVAGIPQETHCDETGVCWFVGQPSGLDTGSIALKATSMGSDGVQNIFADFVVPQPT